MNPEDEKLYSQAKFTGSDSKIGGGLTQYFDYGGKQYSTSFTGEELRSAPGSLTPFLQPRVLDIIKQINAGTYQQDTPLVAPTNAISPGYNPAVISSGVARDQYNTDVGTINTGIAGLTGQMGTQTGQTGTQTQNFPTSALQPGASGQSVKQLQDYLVSQGMMTQEQVNTGYGVYGPQTTEAVRKLQEKLGVDNSSGVGFFGPKTISALSGAPTGNQVNIQTANVALQSIIQNTNALLAGRTLTPEQQALLNQINGLNDQKTQALATGQTATQTGDFKGANTSATTVKDTDTAINTAITKLYDELKANRTKETDVETQLANLRNQAVEDKNLLGDQTIPMGTIVGQQASKMKIYQQAESNLLAKLGIVQKEGQAIRDDLDLQFKIADKLRAEEDAVVNRASKLADNQKSTLALIADTFKNVDIDAPENASIKAQLQQMALQGGIEADLALAAARGAYKQQLFDNAITTQKANTVPLSQQSDRLLSPAEQQLYGVPSGTTLNQVEGQIPVSPTVRGTLNTFNQGLTIATQLESQLGGLNLADSTASTISRGTRLTAEALLPSTPAGLYESQKGAFLTIMARAAGEKGVVTDNDVARIAKALPGFFDTKDSANRKIKDLKSIFTEINARAKAGYTGSPLSGVDGGDVLGLGIEIP